MAASLATCVTQQRAPAAAGQRGSWWLDARSLAGVERGHAAGMEISHDHQSAVVAAVDVHYLGSGGARAAVVLASDASRGGELIRHFWGEELLYAPCNPGQ